MRPAGLKSAAELGLSKPCGTRMRYIAGCRCDLCRRVNANYAKERARAKASGEPWGKVSATRAKAHLAYLSSKGVGYKSVSPHAGVAASILAKIKYGQRKQIRAATEQKILAVTVEMAAPKSMQVAAWRTRMLLRELRALGFSKAAIARELGLKTPALQCCDRDRDRVTLKTERAMLAAHKRLLSTIPRRRFTEAEREVIRRDYPYKPTIDISTELRRTLTSTYQQAVKLGLKKSPEYLASPEARRWDGTSGLAYRYPTGHVPANKGLRRPGWAPGRMAATQFKKDQRPHTWKPIGTEVERKDGYVWVKVRDDAKPARLNWISKHEAVWVAANGPLPEGQMVIFRDGGKRNFAPSNLEAITLAQNCLRNSFRNFAPELVQVIQLRGAVNRQINQRRPPPKGRLGRPPKRLQQDQRE